MEIKAIPTRYKGYHFRSRLEARWAVYFDACEIDWVYEPQGYELATGEQYLPDFILYGDTFVEVKPYKDITAFDKALRFIREMPGKYVLICLGGAPDYCSHPFIPGGETAKPLTKNGKTHFADLVICDSRMKYGPFFYAAGGVAWDVFSPYSDHSASFLCDQMPIHAARSARFEHGECGPT